MTPYLIIIASLYLLIGVSMAIITYYMNKRLEYPTDKWANTIVTIMCLLFWPLFFIRRK